MTPIVFIEPNKLDSIPFTTSDVIAEYAEVGHKKIKLALDKYRKTVETFGLLVLYETESNGGRPEVIYKLNEQQATFLITLLKNTPVVIEFKRKLVAEFFAMRNELQKRELARIALKPIRRSLTDVIQENPDKGKWSYKLYTDLAYKAVLGKIAAQVRKERNAPKKAVAVEYMSADEIKHITKVESQISVLHEMGYEYEQVKAMLFERIN